MPYVYYGLHYHSQANIKTPMLEEGVLHKCCHTKMCRSTCASPDGLHLLPEELYHNI